MVASPIVPVPAGSARTLPHRIVLKMRYVILSVAYLTCGVLNLYAAFNSRQLALPLDHFAFLNNCPDVSLLRPFAVSNQFKDLVRYDRPTHASS
jgi:hypothetical protein